MPAEFWREVVDRVAAEVPDTLLLAEAFWLLEGYFVRTLGMHRVYNSAFMHMLRDEDNAGYRRLIKETLEFDPEILKRYVNFMNNPDEKTAVEQFGKGDKYFGVATVLATLPGLPMLGHGQVEGFGEKYGMEFRRATLDEQPDPWLVERHEREIFPLLHRRDWFAEAHDFLLYDFHDRRRRGRRERVRLLERPRPDAVAGRLPQPVRLDGRLDPRLGGVRASRRATARSGWSAGRWPRGWACPTTRRCFVTFRDARTGLEYLRSGRELRERGLWTGAGCLPGPRVLGVPRARGRGRRAVAPPGDRLGGRGVPSLEDALRELQLEPVHDPLRAVFDDGHVAAVLDGTAADADLDVLEERLAARADAPVAARDRRRRVTRSTTAATDPRRGAALAYQRRRPASCSREDRAALLGWLGPVAPRRPAPGADVAADRAWPGSTSCAWRPVVAAGFRAVGLDEGAAWARRRARPGPARPATPVDRPGSRRGSRPAAPGGLARARSDPRGDRDQHVGGRGVARPRPVREPARLGGPPRRHRDGGRGRPTAARSIAAGRSRPRRPATASMRCGSSLSRPARSARRRRSNDVGGAPCEMTDSRWAR